MIRIAVAYLLTFSICGIGSPILGFPDGRYLGEGSWRNATTNSGSYQSYIEFSSNNTRADYAWSNGVAELQLHFVFDGYGNFNVFHNQDLVGCGFCMSIQCEYSIDLGDLSINEVFTFLDNKLLKIGDSFNLSDEHIYWEETLRLLPTLQRHSI